MSKFWVEMHAVISSSSYQGRGTCAGVEQRWRASSLCLAVGGSFWLFLQTRILHIFLRDGIRLDHIGKSIIS